MSNSLPSGHGDAVLAVAVAGDGAENEDELAAGCRRSSGSPHGVPATAKTLTPIAALVLAIGAIHRADVLLHGTGGGASSGLGPALVMR